MTAAIGQPPLVFAGGVVVGVLVTAVGWWLFLSRPLRRDRDRWQLQAFALYRALVPFVPPVGRARHLPSGRASWRWRCGWHNLLGGRFGEEFSTSGDVLDEAREHFREEHLTAANFAGARRAIELMKAGQS